MKRFPSALRPWKSFGALLLAGLTSLATTSIAHADSVWLGTAPSCNASPSQCTDMGWNYVKSDKKGDGSTCLTGTKVLCTTPYDYVIPKDCQTSEVSVVHGPLDLGWIDDVALIAIDKEMHFQGSARYGDYLIMSLSGTISGLVVADLSSRKVVNFVSTQITVGGQPLRHPDGMQRGGNILAVGNSPLPSDVGAAKPNSAVQFYDLSTLPNLKEIKSWRVVRNKNGISGAGFTVARQGSQYIYALSMPGRVTVEGSETSGNELRLFTSSLAPTQMKEGHLGFNRTDWPVLADDRKSKMPRCADPMFTGVTQSLSGNEAWARCQNPKPDNVNSITDGIQNHLLYFPSDRSSFDLPMEGYLVSEPNGTNYNDYFFTRPMGTSVTATRYKLDTHAGSVLGVHMRYGGGMEFSADGDRFQFIGTARLPSTNGKLAICRTQPEIPLDPYKIRPAGVTNLSLGAGVSAFGGAYGVPDAGWEEKMTTIDGLVKIPADADQLQLVGTLAASARPKKTIVFNSNAHKGQVRMEARPDGTVYADLNTGNAAIGWLSLGNMSFSTGTGKPLPLKSGMTSYGGIFGDVTYEKIGRLVFLSGLVKSTTWGHVATLPADSRPHETLVFSANAHETQVRVTIATDGKVTVHPETGPIQRGWVSLGGIVFATGELTPISLAAGFRPNDDGYSAPSFVRQGSQVVLHGLVVKTGTNWGVVGKLPAGARPDKQVVFHANAHGDAVRVDVLPNGDINVYSNTGSIAYGWVSLAGISFHVN